MVTLAKIQLIMVTEIVAPDPGLGPEARAPDSGPKPKPGDPLDPGKTLQGGWATESVSCPQQKGTTYFQIPRTNNCFEANQCSDSKGVS